MCIFDAVPTDDSVEVIDFLDSNLRGDSFAVAVLWSDGVVRMHEYAYDPCAPRTVSALSVVEIDDGFPF